MGSPVSSTRLVVGAMTGTSIDGLDLALARITGSGLSLRPELLRHRSYSLENLTKPLRNAANGAPFTAGECAKLATEFGRIHARSIGDLLEGEQPDLIAVHGQTIFHAPPHSWQLINPAPIAHHFDCPVGYDFRSADIAAGGQGAPITPLADWILFRHPSLSRAVLNLGGFANATILPAQKETESTKNPGKILIDSIREIRGFDICPCNQILDAVARTALGCPFDRDGAAATAGTPDPEAENDLMSRLSRRFAREKSYGTGDEELSWVHTWAARLTPSDLAATATRSLATFITRTISEYPIDEIILAGGGALHKKLVLDLSSSTNSRITTTKTHGIPVLGREALAMAILGALSADRIPITLPQITGCPSPAPISGTWMKFPPTISR